MSVVEVDKNLAWLSKTFLEAAIRSSDENDNVQVKSYDVKRSTAPGDNYSSEMYRVGVEYLRKGQQETRSLVIKVISDKEEMARLTTEAKVFPREIKALSSVTPAIYSLLEETGASQLYPFAAQYFYSQSNPDLIVMEDLKEKGYKLADRCRGLDMEHSLLVMRKIARFHASSAVLHEKHPEIIESFYEGKFNDDFRDNIDAFFGKGMKNFATEVENWPDYKERFAEKLHNIADKTADILIKILTRDDNEFNILRHGDLWLNNMMFHYSDSGKVIDVRFVDFQNCYFGSPATDLHYFIHTSVSTDLISRHHELVKEYHKTLTETFSLLGYQHLAPTMAQLEQDLHNKSQYAIILSSTVLPVILADPNFIPDIGKVFKQEDSVHFSDVYKKTMEKYLLEFERKGWFETSNMSNGEVDKNLVWLNKTFLETAIRSSDENDNVQVKSYDVKRATAAGDNYASEMYRVTVQYQRKGQSETRSLVIKAIPDKEEMARLMIENKAFSKESMVLSSVTPAMHSLLQETSASQLYPFSPQCFYSQSNPDLIVMEDLKEGGYKLAERCRGLDMEHSLLVMRKIARFHASSAVLREKHPEKIEPFYEGLFSDDFRNTIDAFFGKGMKNFAIEVENWPDYKERFAEKLHNIADNTVDMMIKVLTRDDNEFNVLRHGDLWLNNMMFLYSDSGKVIDVRFVDFQICYFGSPVIDLHYFIHTSVSRDLISRHHELVQEYHKTLTETFSLLGYQHLAPAMAQLEQDLHNKRQYAIILSCTVLPVVMVDPNFIPDMEKIMKKEDSVHFSDVYKKTIQKYLLEFERKGWV